MRKGWNETTLGDIASWSSGKNLSSDKRHETGLIPILGANGIIGRTNEVLLDEELITVGRVGACGETHRSSGPVWISDNALIVIPTEQVTIDLLFYVLSTFNYQSIISGTTQPLITQSKMKSQVVNLPPLNEQKRIVDVVSSVDAYIDALQQQADTARSVRNAVAQRAINSGYPTLQLSQIGRIVTGSTPSTKRLEYWEPAEVDFITPGDFGEQLLISNASRKVSREGARVARALSSYSVLQVCIGATIGKVGYVSHDVVTNQQINSVTDLEELDAYFVSLMLSTNELQVNISDRAGTTTLPIISKSAWGELSIPWPDTNIREGISLMAKSIDECILVTDIAVAKAKNLRSSLLSELLSGEHEIPASYDSLLGAA